MRPHTRITLTFTLGKITGYTEWMGPQWKLAREIIENTLFLMGVESWSWTTDRK